MAYEGQQFTYPGLRATSTSLATKQYYWIMAATTAGQCKVIAAVDDTAIGILQNKPGASEHAVVVAMGFSKVVAGTSVGWHQGITVGWDTTGKAVPRSTAVATFPWPKCGALYYNLEGTTPAKNDIISVLVCPNMFPDN